jgi:hypothetical protein
MNCACTDSFLACLANEPGVGLLAFSASSVGYYSCVSRSEVPVALPVCLSFHFHVPSAPPRFPRSIFILLIQCYIDVLTTFNNILPSLVVGATLGGPQLWSRGPSRNGELRFFPLSLLFSQ